MSKLLHIVALVGFLIFTQVEVKAQEQAQAHAPVDSSLVVTILPKAAVASFEGKMMDTTALIPYKPDPIRAIWMGAIIPGYGQIMNRKFWKLPIVYGGIAGCVYAIVYNSGNYNKYTAAYSDIIDTDPTTNRFMDVMPTGYTLESYVGISVYISRLKTGQENFRRYRDLSVIGIVGFYALTLVDAYVDAQLFDFDISPDLSLHIQPTLMKVSAGNNQVLAMRCSFNFR